MVRVFGHQESSTIQIQKKTYHQLGVVRFLNLLKPQRIQMAVVGNRVSISNLFFFTHPNRQNLHPRYFQKPRHQ